jgi:hypothetical protein
MKVEITQEMVKAIGLKSLKPYGITEEGTRWSTTTIDLRQVSMPKVKKLLALVKEQPNTKGARAAGRDLAVWIEASEKGAEVVKCRDAKHFSALCFEFLQKKAPGHKLYKKDDKRDTWVAYYVGSVKYHPKEVHQRETTPASTELDLFFVELGKRKEMNPIFWEWECRGLTVPEILASKGYLIETPDLLAAYKASLVRYLEHHDKLGRQFLAVGVGTTDLDGNEEYRWNSKTLDMVRSGAPSRVVIDIIREGDEERSREEPYFDPYFWSRKSMIDVEGDPDPNVVEPGTEDEEGERPQPEVPIFMTVPVFDLKRHVRLRVHIDNLAEYKYSPELGDKLVLPSEHRELINILLQNRGEFRDIISNKGGGAVILCAGPPGVGKTLTAEVFAEVEKRPLYSVQCSQLGTDEKELEGVLLRSFSRAQRWNAILLLDEADVYVRSRGTDLQQNAIVGVFLRVLEYYGGVLFLTTNRADLVDDAILSRCIARVEYEVPPVSDQVKIWRILSEVMGVSISEAAIKEIVSEHSDCTGRDIKNLLKLARLHASAKGAEVTPEVISFVRRFKPTGAARAPASS